MRRDVTGDVEDTDPGVGEAGDRDLLTRIRAEHERVGPGAIAPVVGDPDVVNQGVVQVAAAGVQADGIRSVDEERLRDREGAHARRRVP